MDHGPDDMLLMILAEVRAGSELAREQSTVLLTFLSALGVITETLNLHTTILRQVLQAATQDAGGEDLIDLLTRFEHLLSAQLTEIRAMRVTLGVLPDQVEVAVQDGLFAARSAV